MKKKVMRVRHPSQTGWSVRTVFVDGKQFVCAGDLARATLRSNYSKTGMKRIPQAHILKSTPDWKIAGGRTMYFVSREAVDTILEGSLLPFEKSLEFKNWLFREVFKQTPSVSNPSLFEEPPADSKQTDEITLLREQNRLLKDILQKLGREGSDDSL